MISERRAARLLGTVTWAGIGVSLGIMTLVGLWRSPAAVPRMDGPGPFPVPPWAPGTDLAVTVVLWAAMVAGTTGIAAGLSAVRRGWRPGQAYVLAGGLLAVTVLTLAPPMGSTDPMDYAAYGRMVVTGHNPHFMTPAEFRATGDPVGLLAPAEWQDIPSVYGPVATAAHWAAAALGDGSAVWTVVWLKVWNAVAFAAVALALVRLAGPDPARRLRVHLLWTLNPLMLWALIGAAHVDGLAAAFAVTGLCLVGRRERWRVRAAGLLLGAAAATKAPYALAGLGMAWQARGARWTLAVWALAVPVAGYAVIGPSSLFTLVRRGQMPSWNTPWELLVPVFGERPPSWVTSWGSLVLAAGVTLILLRGLPEGPPWLRPCLAVGLAWVLTTPVYYPWYEALVFPLIALAPASRLDWFHLGRLLVATGGCLPGIVCRLGDSWLRSAVFHGPLPYLIPGALLTLTLALLTAAVLRPRTARPAGPPALPRPVPVNV